MKFECNTWSWVYEPVSIKTHPVIKSIRNKRKRTRAVKKLNRSGVKTFLRATITEPETL